MPLKLLALDDVAESGAVSQHFSMVALNVSLQQASSEQAGGNLSGDVESQSAETYRLSASPAAFASYMLAGLACFG